VAAVAIPMIYWGDEPDNLTDEEESVWRKAGYDTSFAKPRKGTAFHFWLGICVFVTLHVALE